MENMELNPREVLSLIGYGKRRGFVVGVLATIVAQFAYNQFKLNGFNSPSHFEK